MTVASRAAWPTLALACAALMVPCRAEPVLAGPGPLAHQPEPFAVTPQRSDQEPASLLAGPSDDAALDSSLPLIHQEDLQFQPHEVPPAGNLGDRAAELHDRDGWLLRDALLHEGARFRDEQQVRQERDEQLLRRDEQAVPQGEGQAAVQPPAREVRVARWGEEEPGEVSNLSTLFQVLREYRNWILSFSVIALLLVWLGSRNARGRSIVRRLRRRVRVRQRRRIRLRSSRRSKARRRAQDPLPSRTPAPITASVPAPTPAAVPAPIPSQDSLQDPTQDSPSERVRKRMRIRIRKRQRRI